MKRISAALLSIVAVTLSFAGPSLPAATAPVAPPIVILISVDGFRADYLERLRPPTLTRLAEHGVRSKGLIPQFPSKTFPNHYTLVTGLRVARHGIVSNNMVAPDIKGRFTMANREVTKDPRWWGGEPIWNTAERQGKVAGAMFWPGSETAINGRQPTYWLPFDDTMPHEARVGRVLEWLDLPDGRRPSFLTLYFSDVDTAGHNHGPDSPEVREAVAKVDRSIGEVVAGVEARGLAARVNYVIVSDHGMAQLSRDRVILLDDYLDPSTVDVLDWSPVLALSPRDGNVERVYAALKGRHKALEVYRNSEIPRTYGALAGHPRVPAIMGIAKEGWSIASRRDLARWNQPGANTPGGAHGYDPRTKSMLGLFLATGPGLRTGREVKPFENIHVYGLMCALLGIDPAPNDGQPEVTSGLLRPAEARPPPPN